MIVVQDGSAITLKPSFIALVETLKGERENPSTLRGWLSDRWVEYEGAVLQSIFIAMNMRAKTNGFIAWTWFSYHKHVDLFPHGFRQAPECPSPARQACQDGRCPSYDFEIAAESGGLLQAMPGQECPLCRDEERRSCQMLLLQELRGDSCQSTLLFYRPIHGKQESIVAGLHRTSYTDVGWYDKTNLYIGASFLSAINVFSSSPAPM